jgi:hypothetical protein
MTPQMMMVTIAGAGTLGAKFYLGKDWKTAVAYGLALLAVYSIVTAKAND